MREWIVSNAAVTYFVPVVALLGGLRLVEATVGLRSRSRPWRPRWWSNLGLGAISFGMAGALPLTTIALALWSQRAGVGLGNAVALPAAVLAVVFVLVRGLVVYGVHYALHKVPWLWRIHRVHHLDTENDVTTSFRQHPIEMLIAVLSNMVVVIALGPPAWLVVVLEVADLSVSIFSHGDFDLPEPLAGVLGRVVITPRVHRIHHSSWQPETDSNFGTTIPLWDMVFGTFRPDPRVAPAEMQLGLSRPRGPEVDSVWWLLRSPWLAIEGDAPEGIR